MTSSKTREAEELAAELAVVFRSQIKELSSSFGSSQFRFVNFEIALQGRLKEIGGISALFDVGDAYYNYIDTQNLRGEKRWRTPAQRARIKLPLGERYQLLNLIKTAYAED